MAAFWTFILIYRDRRGYCETEDENFFTDEDGWIIYDLFNIITPLNLYLFQTDNGYNVFPMVGHDDVICEIISVPDECCGLPDFPEPVDVGDDYETLDRYAKARLYDYI